MMVSDVKFVLFKGENRYFGGNIFVQTYKRFLDKGMETCEPNLYSSLKILMYTIGNTFSDPIA